MKKVYGYIRVSTVKQGNGVSLIEQKEAITRYAEQYHLEIIQWFEEKETAAKQGRPLFNTLIKLLKKGKAHGVIIHKIDRSARNLRDWTDLGELIDQGVEIHFAHESLDLQARGGRLSADIQAVIAADYIRNLRQEAIKGIYGRLKQGIYPFQAPIGYLNTGAGKYKIFDPVKGPLVLRAFELYATQKYTLKTLSKCLYELGLRNLRGGKINASALSAILNNSFYMGILSVKEATFKGGHEPLVSPTLFLQVKGILEGKTNQKIKKHEFTFRKLIRCSACRYSLVPELQKGHVYYRCHTKKCMNTTLRETKIESLVLNEFSAIQFQQEESATMDVLLEKTQMEWLSKQQGLLNTLRIQASQIEQKLERLTDCYLDGGLDKETFEKRKIALLQESKTIELKEVENSTEKAKIFSKVKKFLELVKSIKNSYEIGNQQEKRRLLEMATSNLEVNTKNLVISMRSPFLELSQRGFLQFSPPNQNTSRTMYTKVAGFDNNTSTILRERLSKEQLSLLLDLIINQVSQLPESNNDEGYAI